MDQNCTTDQYGNTGCIGTAVSTHSTMGGLPMTGFDLVLPLVLGLAVIIAGLRLRYAS